MCDTPKDLWQHFFNWVMGNGPRHEDEVLLPELPPELPFTRTAPPRTARHHERSVRERYDEWLEQNGPRLFPLLHAGMSILVCILLVSLLLLTVGELSQFGDPDHPGNNLVSRRYVERGLEETGATNIVAGMLLDYRAFDTFGEASVLFAAVTGALTLLALARRGNAPDFAPDAACSHTPREDDAILRGIAAFVIPVILLLGIAIVVNGHLLPGGGFSGGAVLSAAPILWANAYGFAQVRRFFSVQTVTLSSCAALLVYALAKGYSFLTGGNHLASGIPLGEPGAILSGGLILPLNICVGLIVAGALYSFCALFIGGEI